MRQQFAGASLIYETAENPQAIIEYAAAPAYLTLAVVSPAISERTFAGIALRVAGNLSLERTGNRNAIPERQFYTGRDK